MHLDLRHGECKEVMRKLIDEGVQVDSCVTDPPYHLKSTVERFGSKNAAPAKHGRDGAFQRQSKGFMGQTWDGGDIANDPEMWNLVFQLLKPGGHLLAFGGTRTYHRMTCGIEDAGFDIRDCIMWLYGCLDKDTECLTDSGWKNYQDLTIQDQVMQWDSETGNMSWVNPSDIMIYPYEGEMVRIKNRHTDQMLTPNHRVYGKFKRHSRNPKPETYEVLEAGDIKKWWVYDLPMAGKFSGVKYVDPDYAYIVGWWLTDAWAHGDGKAVMFSQSKQKTLVRLREALNKYTPSEYVRESKNPNHADEYTFYVTGNIANDLLTNYPDREMSWDMLNWEFKSRMRLFDGLMDGDGTIKDGKAMTFYSQRQNRRDIFLALALSLGYRAYDDGLQSVYVNTQYNTTQLQRKHSVENEYYTGDVWCVRVPSGAFAVRRNGRPFITGNSGFPKSRNISKDIDKKMGAEREVVGKKRAPGMAKSNVEYGEQSRSTYEFNEYSNEAITDNAKDYEGYGTALKPACEPIVVARKPIAEKSVADNVLTYGTGAINIDGCRVPLNGDYKCSANGRPSQTGLGDNYDSSKANQHSEVGRYPANVIHDGSDEVEDAFAEFGNKNTTWVSKAHKNDRSTESAVGDLGHPGNQGFNDKGTASRFFYCAKANKKDRGGGNNHPTVKPTELMRYLVRMVTPKNGVVLDPFMGSGSTGKAAKLEEKGFIGIDMTEEYYNIAKKRIEETELPDKLPVEDE